MTQRLAVVCAHHPWRTVAAWIGAIVVACVLVRALLGGNLTGEGKVTNNPESLRANHLLDVRFPQEKDFDELVVVRSDSGLATSPAFRVRTASLAAALRATGDTESVAP